MNLWILSVPVMIGASSISLGSLRMRSQKQPPEVVYKKSVLRNFAKFIGKHLCQSLFFNKVEGSACNAVKKESLVRGFSCEFCKISKNTFSHRTLPVAVSLVRKLTKIFCWVDDNLTRLHLTKYNIFNCAT